MMPFRTRGLLVLGLVSFLFVSSSRRPGPFTVFAHGAVSAQDDAFDKALDQAEQAFRQRQYDDAVKFYKRANELKKNTCVDCLWGMARSYDALRAFKKVVETCDQLITIAGTSNQPLVASAHNMKGLAIYNQAKADNETKRFPDAEAAFRNALSASPGMHIAHYNMGIAMLSHGDDTGGIAELNVYLEKDPNGRNAKDAHRMIENPRRARENFAPDFSFATADGGYVSLNDLKGKVVMLDFWGTWCPPCVDSIGSLKRLQKKYTNEPFVLISVSCHDTEPNWRKFIAEKEMAWPQYRDATGIMAGAYDVTAFPSYFVIDHEGVVRYVTRGNGIFTPGNIEDAISKALKKMREAAAK